MYPQSYILRPGCSSSSITICSDGIVPMILQHGLMDARRIPSVNIANMISCRIVRVTGSKQTKGGEDYSSPFIFFERRIEKEGFFSSKLRVFQIIAITSKSCKCERLYLIYISILIFTYRVIFKYILTSIL